MKLRVFVVLGTLICLLGPVTPLGQEATTPATNAPSVRPPPPPQPPLPSPATRPLPSGPMPARGLSNTIGRPTNPPSGYPRAVPPAPTTFRPATNLAPVAAPKPLAPFPLVFDAENKTAEVSAGQSNVTFVFKLTNATPNEVTIDRVQTSCGCTVAKLPAMPWRLPAGTNAQFEVVADLRGKRGLFSKMVYVYTSQGFKALNVKVSVPEPALSPAAERMRNLQVSVADRQAVFRGDCARCHSAPAAGKQGRELFGAVCGVCHEAERRATVVPNLRALKHPTDADHWRNWITHGKAGTLMPAFALTEGGPLSPEQIDSLVAYLVGSIPSLPATLPEVAPAAPSPTLAGLSAPAPAAAPGP